MKRCPKCSRTFPDETQKFCTVDGGLLMPDPPAATFDPNLTVRDTSKELPPLASAIDASEAPTSVQLPNMDAQAASFGTSTFREKPTTPTGAPTSADLIAPPMQPPTADVSSAVQPPSQPLAQPAAPPKKKSALPWILVGLVVLLLLGGGGATALFFLVIKPRLEARNERPVITTRPTPANENPNTNPPNTNSTQNTNANSETKKEPDVFVPPAHSVQFVNSKDNLDGKLAEHYLDFSFYYLNSWKKDPKAGVPGASNFVRLERSLDDKTGEYAQENVTISWYNSNGTFESDRSVFQDRAKSQSAQISNGLPNYERLSEGETYVNSLRAYQFTFKGVINNTAKGDLPYWGRVIFLPAGNEEQKNGVTIIMVATSLASGVQGADDVGVKGELRIILDSFKFRASP